MNASIERRLEVLESCGTPPWRWVFRHEHETEDQARQREGVSPDECVIVFSRLDAEL